MMTDTLSNTLRKLIQQRDDSIDVAKALLAALKYARDQIQHPDQIIDTAIAKASGTLVGEHVETTKDNSQ